jgi:hypothetical protein
MKSVSPPDSWSPTHLVTKMHLWIFFFTNTLTQYSHGLLWPCTERWKTKVTWCGIPTWSWTQNALPSCLALLL